MGVNNAIKSEIYKVKIILTNMDIQITSLNEKSTKGKLTHAHTVALFPLLVYAVVLHITKYNSTTIFVIFSASS